MENRYTEDDKIVRFLYNELNPDEIREIQNKLEEDYDLKSEIIIYNKLLRYLDRLVENPAESSIHKILQFSQNFDKEKSIS